MTTTTTKEPDLIDIKGVCHRLSVSRQTLLNMVDAGRFPLTRFKVGATGRGVRYRSAEISAWIQAGMPGQAGWEPIKHRRGF